MSEQDRPGVRGLFSSLKNLFQRPAESAATETPQAKSIDILDTDRADLLRFARQTPLVYGPWSEFKRLYKQSEQANDTELLGALITRLDSVPFQQADVRSVNTANNLFEPPVSGIAFAGTIAYVLVANTGLRIVDLSDPAQPRLVSRWNAGGYINLDAVVLSGTLALVTERRNYNSKAGLRIVDVSQPGNPRQLTKVEIPDISHVAVMGRYAVVTSANSSAGTLTVLDLTNPARPNPVSSTRIDPASLLMIDGQNVYLACKNSGWPADELHIYDLSDPARPRRTNRFAINSAAAVQVADGYAYVAGLEPGGSSAMPSILTIYDLATGRIHGSIRLEEVASLVVQGRHAYIGVTAGHNGLSSGLRSIDVSDPGNPRLIGELTCGKCAGMALSGSHLLYYSARHTWVRGELRVIEVSHPQNPIVLGMPPSRDTLGYMKRRARRALHTIAVHDPDRYIDLALQILTETGRGRKAIDPVCQWVSMDILYGRSTRYQQAAHGRGSYLLASNRLSIRTREERYPELWNRNPARITALYADPDLPWQTHEAALKMLRSMRAPLSGLTQATLTRFLHSPSPLLITVALRQIAVSLAGGQSLSAETAAETFFLGGKRIRRSIRDYVVRQSRSDSKWTDAFVARLLQLANTGVDFGKQGSQGGMLSNRQMTAFQYLIIMFPKIIAPQIQPETTVLLYATRRQDLTQWVLDTIQKGTVLDTERWLLALEPLPADLRDAAVSRMITGMRVRMFNSGILSTLAFHRSAWIREVGWQLIAVSTTDQRVLVKLWETLLETNQETEALRSAFASEAAISVFNRLGFNADRLKRMVETRPFLVSLLPVSTLETLVRALPTETLLDLVLAVSDLRWPDLRRVLIESLLRSNRLTAFWQAAWKRIGDSEAPVLIARLLEDEAMVATFLQADATDYLDTANPLFADVLGRWVRAHEMQFIRNSPELLKIATHMLPAIRDFGLARAQQLGMDMPFALRLLESELPPSVALGKEFFESMPPGDVLDLEYTAALCDSPKASVRAYGRTFTEALWSGLPKEELFERIAENPDPQMQAYLADKLLHNSERFERVETFDRSVLRVRDRGRKAKELVKRRLVREPSRDVGLLLEMARSRTQRDSEWALGQLALLAMEGVEIEGFGIEGLK